jgi:low affinity Fe/Cu permease
MHGFQPPTAARCATISVPLSHALLRRIGVTVTSSETVITTANPDVDPTQPTTIEKPPGLFLKFANWVSEAMGRPTNIAFWFVLVGCWTLIFAIGGPHLASGTWLPRWFTSTGYNFPLNLITTVAELFIGFLVAAAANRAQDALTVLLAHIRATVERDAAIERELKVAIAENTELTKQVHDLQVTMSQQTVLLEEIHRHFEVLGLFPPPAEGSATPA